MKTKNTVSQEVFEEYVVSIHNIINVEELSYLDIKSPSKEKIVNYATSSGYKLNFKSLILKYKEKYHQSLLVLLKR